MNIKTWLKGKRRRWSGRDRHFGPITLSDRSSAERYYGIVLDSGDDEDTCHLRIYLGARTLLLELPPLVDKYRKWVDTSRYDWGKPGGGYWEVHSREFGIQWGSEGFVLVFLGPQTNDSTTTKSWCTHLPWTQWRFIRFSLYDTAGAHFWTQLEKDQPKGRDEEARRIAGQRSDARWEAEKACPKVAFLCVDYDGADIIATTHIEEREWKRGEKWCSWLSWFYRPMVKRSLDIHYSAEVGQRKGSWKGGTLGCSINMLPGELHDDAFIRHCVKEQLTYMGPLPKLAELAVENQ